MKKHQLKQIIKECVAELLNEEEYDMERDARGMGYASWSDYTRDTEREKRHHTPRKLAPEEPKQAKEPRDAKEIAGLIKQHYPELTKGSGWPSVGGVSFNKNPLHKVEELRDKEMITDDEYRIFDRAWSLAIN
jgi:hypothetical protein